MLEEVSLAVFPGKPPESATDSLVLPALPRDEITSELKVPEVLLPQFSNQRICVVDDVPRALQRLHRMLEPYFPTGRGNQIKTFGDSEQAAAAILRAAKTEHPFTVLVTDLFMKDFSEGEVKGLNGDELIRCLLDNEYYLPTVMISGSWANEIKAGVVDWLFKANNEITLRTLTDQAAKELKGIPFTTLQKYRGGTQESSLAEAVAVVSLLRESASFGVLNAYFDKFRPTVVETTPSKAALARMTEIAYLLRTTINDTIRVAQREFPEALDHPPIKALVYVANNLRMWEGISFKQFSDPQYGRHNIHNFDGTWFELLDFGNLYQAEAAAKSTPTLRKLLADPRFREIVSACSDTVESLHAEFCGLNEIYKKPFLSHIGVSTLIKGCLDDCRSLYGSHKVKIIDPKNGDRVTTEAHLFRAGLSQLVMNAIKAVRKKEDGKVTVSGAAHTVAGLDPKRQQFFLEKGYQLDDSISEIWVTDNGPGIASEVREKIFENRFSTFGTSGWGLYFFKQVCERLSLTFKLESTVGQGTTFRVYIPENLPEEQ